MVSVEAPRLNRLCRTFACIAKPRGSETHCTSQTSNSKIRIYTLSGIAPQKSAKAADLRSPQSPASVTRTTARRYAAHPVQLPATMGEQATSKRARRSRWAPVNETEVESKDLRARIDKITRVIATNTIPVDELCRSPSPEPRYDTRGKRVNTRPDRARDKLELERHRLCARMKEIDPSFRPPANMRPLKVADKLYIPKEKEGTINFIGLILGPRGTTQKALERDFNCRVAIRGKGSVKDGRARGPPAPDDDDKLHVVISAEGFDAYERIERCKEKIKDIITPRADDENAHKQMQLFELARINGTLRDQDRDPNAFTFRNSSSSGYLRSSNNGTQSNSSRDGPKGGAGRGESTPDDASNAVVDAEFESLLAEVGDSSASHRRTPSTSAGRDTRALTPRGTAAPRSDGQGRPTPPWLLPGAFATRPAAPPPSSMGPTDGTHVQLNAAPASQHFGAAPSTAYQGIQRTNGMQSSQPSSSGPAKLSHMEPSTTRTIPAVAQEELPPPPPPPPLSPPPPPPLSPPPPPPPPPHSPPPPPPPPSN